MVTTIITIARKLSSAVGSADDSGAAQVLDAAALEGQLVEITVMAAREFVAGDGREVTRGADIGGLSNSQAALHDVGEQSLEHEVGFLLSSVHVADSAGVDDGTADDWFSGAGADRDSSGGGGEKDGADELHLILFINLPNYSRLINA